MNNDPVLISTRCAICGASNSAVELYPANFSPQDLNPAVFSARRVPDKIHYRMVRCLGCGLVRSDPMIDQESMAKLYAKSIQTYDQEVPNLIESYARYLDRAMQVLFKTNPTGAQDRALLEIGCGSGFFLEKALKHGFSDVAGIEPSQQAVEKSPASVRPNIICDILRPGLLAPDRFDLICMFQVFDHIADPGMLLDECCKALKPGGGILCLNHDVQALSARLLGERSPIIDIEHTYLYSKTTIGKIFQAHGFTPRETGSATNIYTIRYLLQLLPLPKKIKAAFLSLLSDNPVGRAKLPVRLGNLYLIAQKP